MRDVESEQGSLDQQEQLAVDIKAWMDSNRLKMNTAKTEFIYFGSKQQLQKCTC